MEVGLLYTLHSSSMLSFVTSARGTMASSMNVCRELQLCLVLDVFHMTYAGLCHVYHDA